MFYRESKIQQAIVKYAKLARLDVFSIPNGADVPASNRIRLKSEGLLPGVPDLFFPVPSKNFHGLFMEVKAENGRLSKEQKGMVFAGEEVPDTIYQRGEGVLLADGHPLLEVKFPLIKNVDDWKRHILSILRSMPP